MAAAECFVCGVSARYKCRTCGCVYCSEECQRIDWRTGGHSQHCGKPGEVITKVGVPWFALHDALVANDPRRVDHAGREFTQNTSVILQRMQQEFPQALEEVARLLESYHVYTEDARASLTNVRWAFARANSDLADLDSVFEQRLQQSDVTSIDTLDAVRAAAHHEQTRIFELLSVRCDLARHPSAYASLPDGPSLRENILIRVKRMQRHMGVFRLVNNAIDKELGQEAAASSGPTVEEIQAHLASGRGNYRGARGHQVPNDDDDDDDDSSSSSSEEQPDPAADIDDVADNKPRQPYHEYPEDLLNFGNPRRRNKFISLVFDASWNSKIFGRAMKAIVGWTNDDLVRTVYFNIYSRFLAKELTDIVSVAGGAGRTADIRKAYGEIILAWKGEDHAAQVGHDPRRRREAAMDAFTRMMATDRALLDGNKMFWFNIVSSGMDILRTIAVAGLLGDRWFVSCFNLLSPATTVRMLRDNIPSLLFSDIQEDVKTLLPDDVKDITGNFIQQYPTATNLVMQASDTSPPIYTVTFQQTVAEKLVNTTTHMPPELIRLAQDEQRMDAFDDLLKLYPDMPPLPRNPVTKKVFAAGLLETIFKLFRHNSVREISQMFTLPTKRDDWLTWFLSLIDERTLMYASVAAAGAALAVSAGAAPLITGMSYTTLAKAYFLASRFSLFSEFIVVELAVNVDFLQLRLLEYDALEGHKELLPKELQGEEFDKEYRRLVAPRGFIPAIKTMTRRVFRKFLRSVPNLGPNWQDFEEAWISPSTQSRMDAIVAFNFRKDTWAASSTSLRKTLTWEGRMVLYGVGTLLVGLGTAGVAAYTTTSSRPATPLVLTADAEYRNIQQATESGEAGVALAVLNLLGVSSTPLRVVVVRGAAYIGATVVSLGGYLAVLGLYGAARGQQQRIAPKQAKEPSVLQTPPPRKRRLSTKQEEETLAVAATTGRTFGLGFLANNLRIIAIIIFFLAIIGEFYQFGLAALNPGRLFAPIPGLTQAFTSAQLTTLLHTARQVIGGIGALRVAATASVKK